MSAVPDASVYFPERPPTWAEVVTTLLVVATVSGRFVTDSVSVPLAVAGFLLSAVTIGPGAASGFGQLIGQWFRDIGNGGRASAIVVFAAGVVILSQVAEDLVLVLADAAAGGMIAIALYVVVQAVRAGGVEGWTTDRVD